MNRTRPVSRLAPAVLRERLAGARAQLRALIGALPPTAWLGPRGSHLNPPLWEYGHVVWFQERWCLREQADGTCTPSLLPDADALYDSSAVPHDTRWDLPLPGPEAVDDYAARVADAVGLRLQTRFGNDIAYFSELCLYHELMHIEAWWMAFQACAYAPPGYPELGRVGKGPPLTFDASEVALGSLPDAGFVFDNEKWAHVVSVPACEIDADMVSEAAFRAFVDAGGYTERACWSDDGWDWREAQAAQHPLYWRQQGDGQWQVRRFERWLPLHAHVPMLHVNRYEAEAYATWQGRRLPDVGEWLRATGNAAFRWGGGWEWTRDAFAPYPAFAPDPYRDYSQPWFHTHGELRGGGPVTDRALKRPGFRNFYRPERRDPFVGFRTVSA